MPLKNQTKIGLRRLRRNEGAEEEMGNGEKKTTSCNKNPQGRQAKRCKIGNGVEQNNYARQGEWWNTQQNERKAS